jgi:hypothetical protein
LTFGDLALEFAKGEIVVLDLDGQAFGAWLFRNSLRYSPALVHPFSFQSEIEVVRPSVMLLHYELRHTHRFLFAVGVLREPRLPGMFYAGCREVATHLQGVRSWD